MGTAIKRKMLMIFCLLLRVEPSNNIEWIQLRTQSIGDIVCLSINIRPFSICNLTRFFSIAIIFTHFDHQPKKHIALQIHDLSDSLCFWTQASRLRFKLCRKRVFRWPHDVSLQQQKTANSIQIELNKIVLFEEITKKNEMARNESWYSRNNACKSYILFTHLLDFICWLVMYTASVFTPPPRHHQLHYDKYIFKCVSSTQCLLLAACICVVYIFDVCVWVRVLKCEPDVQCVCVHIYTVSSLDGILFGRLTALRWFIFVSFALTLAVCALTVSASKCWKK